MFKYDNKCVDVKGPSMNHTYVKIYLNKFVKIKDKKKIMFNMFCVYSLLY